MKYLLATLTLCVCGANQAMAAPSSTQVYAAIYDNVLQANAKTAVESCAAMERALTSDASARRAAFIQLTGDWAKVRSTYILGGYDMDAMDYPIMVDYFHMGKEDIHVALERAVNEPGEPSHLLYKNSYKSLTALDDMLFSGEWSAHRQALAGYITHTVCKRIQRIDEGYTEYRDDYLADPDKALSLLINASIENVYKTRDWRIAQVSGLTKQTLGKYLPQNMQYPVAGADASWNAVGRVIDAQAELLSADYAPNLATLAQEKGADASFSALQQALSETRTAYNAVPVANAFDMQNVIPVYQGLQDMQKLFYRQVVGALGVTAKIVDADGD